jgi:hypothetical protein
MAPKKTQVPDVSEVSDEYLDRRTSLEPYPRSYLHSISYDSSADLMSMVVLQLHFAMFRIPWSKVASHEHTHSTFAARHYCFAWSFLAPT